jgi:anti-sigma-K factor RskA
MSANMPGHDRARERLAELLADRSVQSLTSDEARELEGLLATSPGVDADEFDRAAAAVDLASSGMRFEKLPAELRQRVLQGAPEHVSKHRSARAPGPIAPTRAPRADVVRWGGWFAAVAAAVLAIVAWMPRTEHPLTPKQAWQALAASATDEVVWSWKATDDPNSQGMHGEVMWSKEKQAGFMKFVGLSKNDPRVTQYQLWLFCTTRDDKFPVDGGVFDINEDGEVIVAIDARLPIEHLKMAAVTMERPGGVVVSDRGRMVALATL